MEKTTGRRNNSIDLSFFLKFLKDYCTHTSLHGLRYVGQDGRHTTDRLLWILMCFSAGVGALYTSYNIWDRYETSPTMTVLEDTNYPIEKVPFPAITVASSSHIYWKKAVEFQERHLKEADNATIDAFHRLVGAMSLINFGDFDKMDEHFGNDSEEAKILDSYGINMADFMLQVMPSCSEFFEEKCFWLGQIFNCCSLFELQRTEYGFCYSFNSELSEPEMKKVDTNNGLQNLKPYRTSTAGPWGGLKFSVKLPPDQIPPVILDHFVPGILLFVTSPYSFPTTGMELTTGNSVEVLLSATITKATPQVRTLTLERRKCKYHNEGQELGYPEYRQENCHAECHRDSAFQYCNCTPYFYPNEENLPVCNVVGHLCLAKYNDIFNYEKPEAANPFFDDDQEGMSCHCPEDCNHMEYTTDLHVISLMNANTEPDDSVTLVVHFSQPTLMQYRTDVVFGWLDLTVSLGGIAGLFLGFSLLSGAELIYYFTFRLFGVWRSEKRVRKINFQRLPTTMNFIKSRPSYHTTEGYRRKRNIIFPSF